MARPKTRGASISSGSVRCAIYTRKSTDEGLDQEFNSLDAQYEACAAYIASQRHEGWTLARERYDDGGFSGGSMERPALQRLLADIAAGKVQVVVLYKIDRLTRSLSDFARIVEVLDKAGASFVSITQSFNTTTSMGRLTLNMLLSFAQFEREVTAERIRDKFAASRAKGMWMGGTVPLGYRVQDRKLVVEESEAATVRHIFHRYAELGSLQALIAELREQRVMTKTQLLSDGRIRGGGPFTPGGLSYLLKNRTYVGEVVHKGSHYPGEHSAIIDAELWARVQECMTAGHRDTNAHPYRITKSLLAGILVDGLGRRMSPSHARKGAKPYLYYITHASAMTEEGPVWRVSAADAETAVTACLKQLFENRMMLRDVVDAENKDVQRLGMALDRAAQAAARLTDPYHRSTLVAKLVSRVKLLGEHVETYVDAIALLHLLGVSPPEKASAPLKLSITLTRVRIGKQVKLVLGDRPGNRDEALVALISEAQAARAMVLQHPHRTIKEIAAINGRCRQRLTKLLALPWLAPDIVKAILSGSQPADLSARTLLAAKLPLEWNAQKRLLAFA